MSHVYEDNAGPLLWRGSEMAACPTRFTNRTDDQRQQDLFSLKTSKRGTGGCPGSVAVRPQGSLGDLHRQSGRWRRIPYPGGSPRPGARYRASLHPSFARLPVMRRASSASSLPVGEYRAFLFPNEDGVGGNQ